MLTSYDLAQIREVVRGEMGGNKNLPAHLFMPADGVSFDPQASIALPAVGVTSTILSFTVPEGFHGVISKFANVYVGTGFIEGTGDLVWQIFANQVVVRNYDNMIYSLGSINQPGQPGGPILIKEQQLVEFKVKNVRLNVGGAFCNARMSGWFYPKMYEPETAWL